MKKSNNVDVAIIGGGVIGLMTARELLSQGFIAILEKNPQLATEASRAGGGIISPLHPWRYSQEMLDLALWSHNRYSKIAHQLSLSTGVHVPIRTTGMLVPNTDEAERALSTDFLETKLLSSEQVQSIEPGISNPVESVWVKDVQNVRNPALCQALAIDAVQKGAKVFTDFNLQAASRDDSGFHLASDEIKVSANKVVVCAGAWSSTVLEAFSDDSLKGQSEIFPVKGQMIAYRAKPGVLRSIILRDHHYLIPRHDGVIVVGSTVENADFNKELTDEAFIQLKQFAETLLPALKYYPIISQWAGLRPGSHRDKPIICESPETKGLFLNVGHFRNGLLSAPASAKCVVDLMTGSKPEAEPELDVNAYSF